jgi:Tfp pilus assembly protein PilF
VVRILIILLITFVSSFSQLILEAPTLSQGKEAWLDGDLERTLVSVLKIDDTKESAAIKNYNLGYLYYLKADYVTALSHFQKSVESLNPSPYAYLYMARIYEKNGFLSAAYQHILNALEQEIDNYDFLFERARLSELTGRVNDAEVLYQQIVNEYDDKIPPRIALAKLKINQGKYEEAKEILEPDETVYPESDLLISRANLLYAMGKKQASADLILQLCREYPNSKEIQSYVDTLHTKYGISNPDLTVAGNSFKFRFIKNEEINYKVTYGFITLGWVNVRVGQPDSIDGKTVYPVRFFLNSNPDFSMMISLNQMYESYIDAETFNAIRTNVYTPGDDNYLAKAYQFKYDQNMLLAYIIHADGRFEKIRKLLPSQAQDGVSMLYFARGLVSNKSKGKTTVVIDEEYKFGYINYLNESEEIEINGEDVNSLKIFARADFSGVAGMNGDAWGWFSEGPDYVPLEGKVSIILGSITVTLDDDTPMK